MRKRLVITFIAMMVVAVGVHTLITQGWYPAAIVNGKFIGARSFGEAVASVNQYYEQALKTYAPETKEENKGISPTEVKRATLDKMIENELISHELKAMVGNEVPLLVQQKINALGTLSGAEFESAVKTLYGLTPARFRALVLEPQAREEILERKISAELNNSDFQTFLSDLRQKASVRILISDLYWENGKVVARGK